MTNLIKPVITEKSMAAASRGVYTFEVVPTATKHGLKVEIENLFNVHVEKITTLTKKRPAKTTGRRRLSSPQAPLKQARVWLKEGESIALFDLKEQEG